MTDMWYSISSVFMVFMLCCLAVLSGIVKYVVSFFEMPTNQEE